MGLTTRQLSILCLGALAAAITACTGIEATQCEATGVLCPAGYHCAAAEPVCIPNMVNCGNATIDKDEVCDDGNTKDGDTCASDCRSDLSCGNGIRDTRARIPEVCDDGNTKDGDGCSHDCLSEEKCGNGIKDIDEACDDGNTADGDGCSRDCKSKEFCGNGITDDAIGEVCDPPVAGTCSPDCRSLLQCGNAKIDPGEECDDGQANNGNNKDCRADCVINRCGDGRINLNGTHHEDCDGGPLTADHIRTAVPTEKANCNIDCTTPSCGDGKVNRSFTPTGAPGPEQCDVIGANADNRDCTAACQINVCGDNHKNTVGPLHVEGCDDGNRVDSDDCTNACIAKDCGDGIVGPGEECDLGPSNSDTGACLESCKIAKCGDGKVRTGVEECDGTAGCSAACRRQECGNSIIDPGEECDDGPDNANSKDCRADCLMNRCGDGHRNTAGTHLEACDATTIAPPGSTTVVSPESQQCNIDCTTPMCGDGKVNRAFTPTGAPGPEQCDVIGANADTRDCTAGCQINVCGDNHTIAKCGDGKVRTGIEDCDGGAGCSAACRFQVCGNGIIDPGEECDDGMGNNANNKNCRADCITNRCGDGHRNTAGSLSHREQCDPAPQAGPGVTTTTPTETSACNFDCTDAGCGDSKINRARGEECDNGMGNNAAANDCTDLCKRNVCGDGKRDQQGAETEQCDNGADNGTVGNSCNAACKTQGCGNGIIDVGELCDDGNTNACGTCNATCSTVTTGDRATGMIFAAPSTEYAMGGTDRFTLNDGFTSKTFQFGGTSMTNIVIDISAADSAQMAIRIDTAINGSGLRIDSVLFGSTGIVTLTNRQPTSKGNTAITDNVAAASFFSSATMSGGAAGNCDAGGCAADADCTSNRCVGGSCQTCNADNQCASNLCRNTRCLVCTQSGECTAGQSCVNGKCQ